MTSHDEPRMARTSHSHLFPGAVIMLESTGRELEPCDLLLQFSDEVEVPAEVLTPQDDGPFRRPVLAVDGHTTAAGTTMAPKLWLIKETTPEGAWLALKLGARIPRS